MPPPKSRQDVVYQTITIPMHSILYPDGNSTEVIRVSETKKLVSRNSQPKYQPLPDLKDKQLTKNIELREKMFENLNLLLQNMAAGN
jgi:hypothetical protein